MSCIHIASVKTSNPKRNLTCKNPVELSKYSNGLEPIEKDLEGYADRVDEEVKSENFKFSL